MRALAPNIWLLHLGVNDGRAGIPPAAFRADMAGLVRALVRSFGASPGRIFVAKPSYDAFPGAERLLAAYREEIDRLVAGMSLRPGPDFGAAYAAGRRRWYGTDPVHPNVRGMARMARLWCAAVAPRTPQRERPS